MAIVTRDLRHRRPAPEPVPERWPAPPRDEAAAERRGVDAVAERRGNWARIVRAFGTEDTHA